MTQVLEPAGDFVIVIDVAANTVINGIELPDNTREKEMLFGVVVFVGPEATATHPEDRVLYGPYAGKEVILNGSRLRILRQGQIEAYLRERL